MPILENRRLYLKLCTLHKSIHGLFGFSTNHSSAKQTYYIPRTVSTYWNQPSMHDMAIMYPLQFCINCYMRKKTGNSGHFGGKRFVLETTELPYKLRCCACSSNTQLQHLARTYPGLDPSFSQDCTRYWAISRKRRLPRPPNFVRREPTLPKSDDNDYSTRRS